MPFPLSPEFFETKFWYMWATTFAFQPWHSAVEFRRYLHRFMKEFSRIETLAGVKRTIYNQYDSLVRPLVAWLEKQGVQFITDCTVTDFDLATTEGKIAVTGITSVALLTGRGGAAICNIAGFAYPMLASFKALEASTQSASQKLDAYRQWLTYWVVYAFLTMGESFVVDIRMFVV